MSDPLIVGLHGGHDAAIAAIAGGALLFAHEAEKGSHARHATFTVETLLSAGAALRERPEIIARAGWWKGEPRSRTFAAGAGYRGTALPVVHRSVFMGRDIALVDTTHERAHLFAALGLSDIDTDRDVQGLLIEGEIGAIYRIRPNGEVRHLTEFLPQPGSRYIFPYALAEPAVAEDAETALLIEHAGKTMALAAFASSDDVPTRAEREFIERILQTPDIYQLRKRDFRGHYLYDCGVESEAFCRIARFLTDAISDRIRGALTEYCDCAEPLIISGGCALNCEWNTEIRDRWKAKVFVPPCPNDSGIAIGAAIDASLAAGGSARVRWRVNSGEPFLLDAVPPAPWSEVAADDALIARCLAEGMALAWVQDRCEIGPRALGFRSLLASPFETATRDRLNTIKQRERFRPIAPACPAEVASSYFAIEGQSPFMLYFTRVLDARLAAVTHVDGSARLQTVARHDNERFWRLLLAFGKLTGIPVLCNTSLNFKGTGFINSMTELLAYAGEHGLDGFVVGDRAWIGGHRR